MAAGQPAAYLVRRNNGLGQLLYIAFSCYLCPET